MYRKKNMNVSSIFIYYLDKNLFLSIMSNFRICFYCQNIPNEYISKLPTVLPLRKKLFDHLCTTMINREAKGLNKKFDDNVHSNSNYLYPLKNSKYKLQSIFYDVNIFRSLQIN